MAYETSPEIDFSSVGLVTDIPSNAIPTGAWSNCLDVRCRNGSVQGVNAFEDNIVLHNSDAVIIGGEAMAITQFTPAGASDLVIAYIVKGTDNFGHVVLYDTGTSAYSDITNATADQKFTFDDDHPPQIFVFNEILIVNPGTDAPPQFTDAKVSAGSLAELPGWLNDSTGEPLVPRIMRPFNNRLVAMNIFEEHGAGTGDDVNLPIDFIWSSNITTLQSLTAAEWTAW